MLAHEILTERIALPPDIIPRLHGVIQKWISYIKSTNDIALEPMNYYDTMNLKTVFKQHGQSLISQYKNNREILRKQLLKLINSNLVNYIQNPYPITINDVTYKPSGYNLKLAIVPNLSKSRSGEVNERWELVKYQSGAIVLENTLFCKLSYSDYLTILSESKNTIDIVDEIISVLTHEITHLIQSLSNPQYSIHSKRTEPQLSDYISRDEIDAYAQSFVTFVIRSKETELAAQALRSHDLSLLPPKARELYSYYYHLLTKHFLQASKKDQMRRSQAWNRFNKRIYEKLQDYKQKYSSYQDKNINL